MLLFLFIIIPRDTQHQLCIDQVESRPQCAAHWAGILHISEDELQSLIGEDAEGTNGIIAMACM